LLQLIGYQIDPGLAASATVHFDVTADVNITGANIPFRLKTSGAPGQPDQIFEITQAFSLKKLNSSIDLSSLSSIPAGSTAIQLASTAHALAPGNSIYFEQKTTTATSAQTRRSALLQVTSITTVAPNVHSIAWLPALDQPFDPASTTLKGNNLVATNGETINSEPVVVGD